MLATNKRRLSIIIPAYNEEKTIVEILDKVLAVQLPENIDKEIIIVNDCSHDESEKRIKQYIESHPKETIKYTSHTRNQGKGMAIRTGIKEVSGNWVIIQDADMEYDPQDYLVLLPHLLSGECKVIYGSRFLNRQNVHSYQSFYWGGRFVSLVTNLLYGQHLTDEPTCYKMFDTELLKSIPLECTGFEFCPEVTAKIARKGYKIKEIAIRYYPRSIEEGKKIKWYDGVEAIWTLLKYRLHK
ncbi:MAG: glycosyltransferase family 2 protein [Bacteroidaceae bacterium]